MLIFWISHIIPCLLTVTFYPYKNYEEELEAMPASVLSSILIQIFWISHIIPCPLVVTFNPWKNYEEEHEAMWLTSILLPRI
jgi:hypothetical protein